MRKFCSFLLTAFFLAAGLMGCGSSDSPVTETTIEVKKNGNVIHTIIEDFSEDYYDLNALQNTIQSACDNYNATAGEDSVTVGEAGEAEGILTVAMTYKDSSAYAGFNRQAMFSGTVKDAYNAGYDLNVTLLSAQEEGNTIGKAEILGMGEKHIVIIREAVNVKVWNKILYYSEDVVQTQDAKTVTVTDGDMLTYIIFE